MIESQIRLPKKDGMLLIWLIMAGVLLAGCVRSIPESSTEPYPSGNPSSFPEISTQDLAGETTPEGLSDGITVLETSPSDWSLERAGFQDEDLIILVLYCENPISQSYSGDLSSTPFECTTQEQKPNNLYCFGARPELPSPWLFGLVQNASGEVVFQMEISEEIMN